MPPMALTTTSALRSAWKCRSASPRSQYSYRFAWSSASTRSQPSCFAADGAAPAISGGGAWGKARQTLEANKSAVGVAMQFLVMIDKLHDMHERQVISDLHFEQWSDWAVGV